jgi:hypothetical protein
MSRSTLPWDLARHKEGAAPRQELQASICSRVDAKTCLGSALQKSTRSHQFPNQGNSCTSRRFVESAAASFEQWLSKTGVALKTPGGVDECNPDISTSVAGLFEGSGLKRMVSLQTAFHVCYARPLTVEVPNPALCVSH